MMALRDGHDFMRLRLERMTVDLDPSQSETYNIMTVPVDVWFTLQNGDNRSNLRGKETP